MKRLVTLAALLLLAATSNHASAQTADPQTTSPNEKCRAAPDADPGQAPQPNAGENLTQTLDDCNGVLEPPASGDSGMTEPAPAEGKTPVLKPDNLPPQQPSGG